MDFILIASCCVEGAVVDLPTSKKRTFIIMPFALIVPIFNKKYRQSPAPAVEYLKLWNS